MAVIGFFVALAGLLFLFIFSLVSDQGDGRLARSKRHVRNDGPVFRAAPDWYETYLIVLGIAAIVFFVTWGILE